MMRFDSALASGGEHSLPGHAWPADRQIGVACRHARRERLEWSGMTWRGGPVDTEERNQKDEPIAQSLAPTNLTQMARAQRISPMRERSIAKCERWRGKKRANWA